MVSVVHHFKGKLLLPEEPAAEQQPDSALLNRARIDGAMEKYLSSQVSAGSCDHRWWAVMTVSPDCVNNNPLFLQNIFELMHLYIF